MGHVEHLIHQYGYLAIFIGTFLEGETILIMAGFLAHRGYLNLAGVVMAAFLGSLAGDQLFFFLGRFHSAMMLSRFERWKDRVDKVNRLLARFHTPLILGFRFLYGLRTVTPFVIGTSQVSIVKFVILNAIGALAWAGVIGSAGYFFGQALEAVLHNVRQYEMAVIAFIAVAGAGVWGYHLLRRKRRHSGH